MTVIAWDGKMLAADKMAVSFGVCVTTTKIRRLASGEVLAWCGDQDAGELLAKWYADGKDLCKWPDIQKDKDSWCRLIVADTNGARFFERQPISVEVEDQFAAWGSGRDFALAAMYLGKNAREAVEVACLFESSCGNGVDAFILK